MCVCVFIFLYIKCILHSLLNQQIHFDKKFTKTGSSEIPMMNY